MPTTDQVLAGSALPSAQEVPPEAMGKKKMKTKKNKKDKKDKQMRRTEKEKATAGNPTAGKRVPKASKESKDAGESSRGKAEITGVRVLFSFTYNVFDFLAVIFIRHGTGSRFDPDVLSYTPSSPSKSPVLQTR